MVSLRVHLTDGSILEETVETPRGSERNFPSESDVVAKFAKLAGRVMPEAQVQRIKELVLDLDRLAGMAALVEALASPPKRS